MDNQPLQPAAPKPNPFRAKCSPSQWAEIRVRAEAGEPYDSISALYPITTSSIEKKAYLERWVTPTRIQKAVRGELSPDDPAQPAANVWLERKQKARESVFEGARKIVERGFAMAPVPTTIAEIALAVKLMNEAISPPEDAENKGSVNLAILTSVGFQPRIQED